MDMPYLGLKEEKKEKKKRRLVWRDELITAIMGHASRRCSMIARWEQDMVGGVHEGYVVTDFACT